MESWHTGFNSWNGNEKRVISMNLYTFLSIGYDLLDKIWLSEKGRNPREVIEDILPNEKCKVLDMCCGTFTNGLSIAKKSPNNLVVGLDRSKPMLREGKRKIVRDGLNNGELAHSTVH